MVPFLTRPVLRGVTLQRMITGSLARVTKANLAPADTYSATDLVVGEMDLLLAVGATHPVTWQTWFNLG